MRSILRALRGEIDSILLVIPMTLALIPYDPTLRILLERRIDVAG